MDDPFPGKIFFPDESLPFVTRSAFQPFSGEIPRSSGRHVDRSNNMRKRLLAFSRRNDTRFRNEAELEKEKGLRHMLNERGRREKEKQSYLSLHSLLPIGTKNDKYSIVHIAADRIGQMESCREKLSRRRAELESALADRRSVDEGRELTLVKVKVADPISGIDSMVEVLNYLKALGLKTRNIRSVFAETEFSAEIEIENEVNAKEIEEAMQLTLYEADLKLLSNF